MSVKIAPLYVLRTPDLLLLITGNGDDDDSTNMTRIIANCEDTILHSSLKIEKKCNK